MSGCINMDNSYICNGEDIMKYRMCDRCGKCFILPPVVLKTLEKEPKKTIYCSNADCYYYEHKGGTFAIISKEQYNQNTR